MAMVGHVVRWFTHKKWWLPIVFECLPDTPLFHPVLPPFSMPRAPSFQPRQGLRPGRAGGAMPRPGESGGALQLRAAGHVSVVGVEFGSWWETWELEGRLSGYPWLIKHFFPRIVMALTSQMVRSPTIHMINSPAVDSSQVTNRTGELLQPKVAWRPCLGPWWDGDLRVGLGKSDKLDILHAGKWDVRGIWWDLEPFH